VTRLVSEKIAQNVAQYTFFLNQRLTITPDKSSPSNVQLFCNFQKLLKASNRPMGENSPNLVTLVSTPIIRFKVVFKFIKLSFHFCKKQNLAFTFQTRTWLSLLQKAAAHTRTRRNKSRHLLCG
jgi:hypothetical protein